MASRTKSGEELPSSPAEVSSLGTRRRVLCFTTGPNVLNSFGTYLAIVVPSVLLDVFVLSGLGTTTAYILGGIVIGLQVLTVSLLTFAVFSNPGIIPRQPETVLDVQTREERSKPPERFVDEVIHGDATRLKYCATCRIYRPPRTSHCSVCDCCVANFDHHCPYTNNCVGKRNYGRFFFFVTSLATLTLLSVAICVTVLVQQGLELSSLAQAIKNYPFALAVAIYCVLIMWFTVGLFGYHVFLRCKGLSTYEQIKGHLDKWNPYDKGALRNFRELCIPNAKLPFQPPPVVLRFKETVAPPASGAANVQVLGTVV